MIEKKAYAKINLFLNVIEKRKDGYHNLEMVNAKINMCDDISLKKCHLSTGIIIKSNDLFLSSQDNVILQCARYLQDQYHLEYGIQITINKKIPYGAGLGGNSSDAAAVMHGINELAELNLSIDELQEIGQMFGADIPYCLINELAYVKKTGEQVEKIPNQLKDTQVLLIHPKKHILTSNVFKHADKQDIKTKDIQKMLDAIEKNDLIMVQENMFNSLEDVVVSMDKDIKDLKDYLIEHIGAKGLMMTGSGSTFIKLLQAPNDEIEAFVNGHKDKFLINFYKII